MSEELEALPHDKKNTFLIAKEYRRFSEFCHACLRESYVGICTVNRELEKRFPQGITPDGSGLNRVFLAMFNTCHFPPRLPRAGPFSIRLLSQRLSAELTPI